MSTPTPSLLKLGVMATSRKTDEKRLPIHPAHLERLDADLRCEIRLELTWLALGPERNWTTAGSAATASAPTATVKR